MPRLQEAIRVPGEDEVGLIDYGYGATNGYQWVFPLTPAGQYEKLAPLINAAEPGDMPDFHKPMEMGLLGLQKSDAAMKHMIVISDGDPSPPSPALLENFIAAKVSVSMIAINPHGGQDISIMQAVAQANRRPLFNPQDPSQLPSNLHQGSEDVKRSMLQNRIFMPRSNAVTRAQRHRRHARSSVAMSHHDQTARHPNFAHAGNPAQPGGARSGAGDVRFGLGVSGAGPATRPGVAKDWLDWDNTARS